MGDFEAQVSGDQLAAASREDAIRWDPVGLPRHDVRDGIQKTTICASSPRALKAVCLGADEGYRFRIY